MVRRAGRVSRLLLLLAAPVGAPSEDVEVVADAGAETILHGSLFADGFETAAANLWSTASP